MQSIDIATIGIAGAGTMGLGIAQIAAQSGYKVVLFDINQSMLEKAKTMIDKNLMKAVELGKLKEGMNSEILERISFSHSVEDLKADLIVEAIAERLDIKKELFTKLESINSTETILTSNTSSIPITQIAAGLKHPGRFAGMHFFNPAHIMKLVEVISGVATEEQTAKTVFEVCNRLGKVPVYAKDAPGFIVNRVARQYYVESLKILEEGIADFQTIDALLESKGFKMGPFKLMDLIGVDTNFSVTESMYRQFFDDPKFRPSRIQKQKMDAGHHGRKTGKGFYDYS